MADVDVDRARLAVGRIAPEASSSCRRLKTGGFDASVRKLELDVGQLHGVTSNLDRSPSGVDEQSLGLDHLAVAPILLSRQGRAARSARTRLLNSRMEKGFVM